MSRRAAALPTLLFTTLLALAAGSVVAQVQAVVSIHPYYDLLRQVGGERVEVTRLLPPGASPHTFDPSPRDVAGVRDADLVVLNGGLDVWLENLIEASGTEAEVLVMLAVLDVEAIDSGDHRHEEDHGAVEHEEHEGGAEHEEHEGEAEHEEHGGEAEHGEHEGSGHGAVNPHIWLDPILMVEAVELFVSRLSALDPAGADLYAVNGEALAADLLALDAELRELLAPVAGAPFVPFHDAWPYFAAHYGLDLVVTIEPFPGRDPSPAYLAEALALIADAGATAVFSERQLGPRPAEVVAESAGVALVVLDPVGGGEGVESYQELLRYNARMIADALARGDDR